jgi:hypothetical protein
MRIYDQALTKVDSMRGTFAGLSRWTEMTPTSNNQLLSKLRWVRHMYQSRAVEAEVLCDGGHLRLTAYANMDACTGDDASRRPRASRLRALGTLDGVRCRRQSGHPVV